jgi:hypothetical protein
MFFLRLGFLFLLVTMALKTNGELQVPMDTVVSNYTSFSEQPPSQAN